MKYPKIKDTWEVTVIIWVIVGLLKVINMLIR